MHLRRFASLILGVWLAGSLFMLVVATHNFSAVDESMNSPAPHALPLIKQLGPDGARALLHHNAAELNRWYFEAWEWAQLFIAAVLALTIAAGGWRTRTPLVFCTLMFGAVLGMRFYLTPELVRLGRLIDFLPASETSPDRLIFRAFHIAYSVVEILKLALGMVLGAILLRRSGNGIPHRSKRRHAAGATI